MDADDIAELTRFHRQIEFLWQQPDYVAVGSSLHLIDPDWDPFADQEVSITHEEIGERLFLGDGDLPHLSAMISREAVLAIGGNREEFAAAQDVDLWLRLAEHGKLANLEDALLHYRVHENSITMERRAETLACAQRAVDEAYKRAGRVDIQRTYRLAATVASRSNLLGSKARFAMRAGNHQTGKKHIWRAITVAPFSLRNWWLGLQVITASRLGRTAS